MRRSLESMWEERKDDLEAARIRRDIENVRWSGRDNQPEPQIGTIAFAKVKSISDDTLTCDLYDPIGDVTGEEITVYKPYFLQKTPFHLQTITFLNGAEVSYDYTTGEAGTYSGSAARWAVNISVISELQSVTPDWFVDDVLTVVQDGNNNYWDINSTGRTWARTGITTFTSV